MSLVEKDPAPKPGIRAKVVEEYATLFRTHALTGPVMARARAPSRARPSSTASSATSW